MAGGTRFEFVEGATGDLTFVALGPTVEAAFVGAGQALLAFNLVTGRWPVNNDANPNDRGELSRLKRTEETAQIELAAEVKELRSDLKRERSAREAAEADQAELLTVQAVSLKPQGRYCHAWRRK